MAIIIGAYPIVMVCSHHMIEGVELALFALPVNIILQYCIVMYDLYVVHITYSLLHIKFLKTYRSNLILRNLSYRAQY